MPRPTAHVWQPLFTSHPLVADMALLKRPTDVAEQYDKIASNYPSGTYVVVFNIGTGSGHRGIVDDWRNPNAPHVLYSWAQRLEAAIATHIESGWRPGAIILDDLFDRGDKRSYSVRALTAAFTGIAYGLGVPVVPYMHMFATDAGTHTAPTMYPRLISRASWRVRKAHKTGRPMMVWLRAPLRGGHTVRQFRARLEYSMKYNAESVLIFNHGATDEDDMRMIEVIEELL